MSCSTLTLTSSPGLAYYTVDIYLSGTPLYLEITRVNISLKGDSFNSLAPDFIPRFTAFKKKGSNICLLQLSGCFGLGVTSWICDA